MSKIFAEQIYLLNILFIIVMGLIAYYDRYRARKNETSQEQLANDLYAVVSVFFAFAFVTFGLMAFTGNNWNPENYIEIETLADAQKHFRLQDQELQQIRTSHNNFVGMTKTFVIATAMTLMLVYRILKAYHQDLGRK